MLRASLLALAGLLALPALAQVPKDTFQVQVTLDGKPAPGVTVRAVSEPPGGGEVGLGEKPTDAEGRAVFPVPHRPGLVLVAYATYEGVPYQSQKVSFGNSPEQGVGVSLQVFPRAGAAALSSLSIGPGSHILVDIVEGALDVTEVLRIANRSGQAVNPEGGLVIPLPDGFRDVRGAGGNPVQLQEHVGAALPGPFLPGETEVRVRFRLPFTGRSVDFDQALSLSADGIRLIVAESPTLTVEGEAVQRQDTRESEGIRYRVVDLSTRSKTVTFRLAGLPQRVFNSRWVALALSLGIFVAGFVLALGGRKEGGSTAAARRAAQSERDALLADLEQLEHDRREDRIDEAAYHEDRKELLARLADALRALEAAGP